jgi:alginate O-acetyltransferase complex protein AlgI
VNGYSPHDPLIPVLTGGVLALTLLVGLAVTRLTPRWPARLLAWLLTVSATVSAERLCRNEPAGLRMLAVIAALLLGMKCVVSIESRRAGEPSLAAWRWLAFAALWPGMRPGLFADLGGPALKDAWSTVRSGLVHLGLGVALVVLAAFTWHTGRPLLGNDLACLVATLLLLPGLSLILHFGIFNVLAGLWRCLGVDTRPLFRAPLAAPSLGDFWGRRWNRAFSEMTAIGIYRPLTGVVGKGAATVVAFLTSGALHELAISVPVLAGLGGPTVYFLLHGALVLIERGLERRGRAVVGWGWWSHAWVLGWLAVPLPILFHRPFLEGCVWPLIWME